MQETAIVPSLFDYTLSDSTGADTISKAQAAYLFEYFATAPLFSWADSNNGCEARADAACILMSDWGIPNYKAWLFSGLFLKKHIGGLKQNWNYHVAPILPVSENGILNWYVVDPSTARHLQTLEEWAAGITAYPHSYQVIKDASWYIFHEKKVKKTNWYSRDKQNRKWMIEGLAGINGLSSAGKAALAFNKNRIKNKLLKFQELRRHRPAIPGQ